MAERVMGADLIAPAGKVQFEPQRPYNFRVLLPVDVGMDEDLYVAVESLTVPNMNIEPILIPYLNEDRKVPGPVTFENATMVIRNFVQPDVAAEFLKWFKLVYDYETGGIGLAANIKKQLTLQLFGPQNQSDYLREWNMIGCWPSQFNLNELSMATRGDIHKLNTNIVIDRMEPSTTTSST